MAGGAGLIVDMISQSRTNAALLKTKGYFERVKALRFRKGHRYLPSGNLTPEQKLNIKRQVAIDSRLDRKKSLLMLVISVPVTLFLLLGMIFFFQYFYF